MEQIKIKFNNKTILTEKGVSLKKLLNISTQEKYHDNPIVGALVNGEMKSLNHILLEDADVSEVRLFSSLGKRVYRHSICFLLTYASYCLFPDRHLLIEHSLGDGYYFRFQDDKEIIEEDICAITDKMNETVKNESEIDIVRMPYNEAIEYFSKNNFSRTTKLLKTRNDGSINVYKIDNYQDVAYEPIVSNTSILSEWTLMSYKNNGMLLRYPQSRNFTEVGSFVDNPLLFNVFENTKSLAKILDISCLGDLNEAIANGKYEDLIQLSEVEQNVRIHKIAKSIHERGKVKFVFIAGPSSSGKTTFSLKLSQYLTIFGYNPIKISLDDYYLQKHLVPVDEFGEKDLEALEALDLDFFRLQMKQLLNGEKIHLPDFNFKENQRYYHENETELKDNTIFVIEGIHGLNPALVPDIDKDLTFKIYISALTTLAIDDHNRISTTDNRMIRRMVRDSRTRNVDATTTLKMWPSVERGEKNHIFPFQNNADEMINSALFYEMSALCPYAISLLRSVKPESGEAYTTARRLLKFLELIYSLPITSIPENSLLREFLGGSIFKAV